MARKPSNKPDAVDASSDGANARSFRLNDEQRAEILRMHAEGKRKADIAEAIGTTVATVGRTINGATGTMPTRRSSEDVPAASGVSDTQRRLIAFAVSTLMGDEVDAEERDALKAILQRRIEEARRKATEDALRSL